MSDPHATGTPTTPGPATRGPAGAGPAGVDAAGADPASATSVPRPKGPLEPNDGKALETIVDGMPWARIPIATELFARGDDLTGRVVSAVVDTVSLAHRDPRLRDGLTSRWYVVVSEKIVAITQGRSYFTWEIGPGPAARALCRFVRRTPYGIGLGSPWTMQLAITEAGLPRILAAAAAGVAGKVLRRRGWFYRVAGHGVSAIDGPTPYSAYPSNVSAKLAPREPAATAGEITAALRARLPADAAAGLGGTVVIDSNDLGRDVLGHDTAEPERLFCEMFADNPFGQGRQQTPIAVCVPVRTG